jgi:hypothetical protein
MQIPDSDHILWPILIGFMVIGVEALMLAFRYNHFDPPRDLDTLGASAAAFTAGVFLKRTLTGRKRSGT